MSDWTLRRNSFNPRPGPVLVVVMDGVGIGKADEGNAVHLARTPTLDRIWSQWPTTTLRAHGTAVGLPSDKDMGNSEVGHNALGAGRVYSQGAMLVNQAIENGTLFRGETWQAITDNCREHGTPLHLIGLLSDGNVHSHIDQLFALIREAHRVGLEQLCVHPLLDGRDVPETSALTYIDALEQLLAGINQEGAGRRNYRIASGGGRMLVTMDRYQANWGVVERGWKAHVLGQGRPFRSAREAIETYRREDPEATDQFLSEFVVVDEKGQPVGAIEDHHAVVFFNFRGDRAIEISRAFEEDDLPYFDRVRRPEVLYAGMMQYDGDLLIPKRFLVPPPHIEKTMGEYLARNEICQFACSETQKYGHVTYFWNGNRGGMFDERTETYLEVPSDLVPFEQRPWMKAAEITDATIEALRTGRFPFARINYANGDMVGHTGDRMAAIVAVEAVDLSLARLLDVMEDLGGITLVTADHGNADEMYEIDKKRGGFQLDEQGEPKPKTAHTLNPVSFTIVDPAFDGEYELDPDVKTPGLSNVAATALALMGFQRPEHFDPALIRLCR
jgi:2,3-bisphosphoglycerate-independent phosphoglycerate mutase